MYEPIAEDKGIALLVHSPHELSAHGDRDLLVEAVANLVDNAVKFTPAGGRVEIGLFCGNGENIVRVKDTGSGISEHERDAVLRRFYRSDRIRHTSGLGLGLNLVAAIVRLHGFRFTIVPGSGCVAEIRMPLRASGLERLDPMADRNDRSGSLDFLSERARRPQASTDQQHSPQIKSDLVI
jgi:signal transduction histidine kinase